MADPFVTFPLHPILDGGSCGCGSSTCDNAGKHPAVVGWTDLTASVATPEGCGTGIQTGARSGVFVVDFDTMAAYEANKTHYPPTHTVKTGRGLHLYYQHPGFPVRNSAGKLGTSIDVRGDGGYVVAAGSPHVNGSIYTVIDARDPQPAPEWLRNWDGLRGAARAVQEVEKQGLAPAELARRISLATNFLTTCEPAISGNNGSGVFWNVVQKLVCTWELPLDVAHALVVEHYNPRCVPPWSDDEIIHKLTDADQKSEWPRGCAPEGWDLAKVAQRPTAVPVATALRQRDPAHVYTFESGNHPNGKKKKCTLGNAQSVLTTDPAWCDGVLRYNEFSRRIIAVNPPMRMDAEESGLSDEDTVALASWFEVCNPYLISPATVGLAAVAVARRNRFHPVRDYLDGLPGGCPELLNVLAARVLGATSPHADNYLIRTLVAAVRRIKHPGCQVDTTLILCGKQGVGKSTFVRALFGADWTRSQMPDMDKADASLALLGFWCVELAELDKIIRTETSTVKEFLTRTVDNYRRAYGKEETHAKRQCVFIGTTNEAAFLRDSTGNRRFWPITCGKIDVAFVLEHRDEIWAAAVALEAMKYPHWLDTEQELEAEEARAAFAMEDPWQPAIFDYCAGKEFVTTCTDIYLQCIAPGDAGALAKLNKATKDRIADTLRRLGCAQGKKNGAHVWLTPDALRLAQPSPKEAASRSVEALKNKNKTN